MEVTELKSEIQETELSAIETRNIDLAARKILSYGDMCIEMNFGMRTLNAYLSGIEAVRAGVPFAETPAAREKERTKSYVLQFDESGTFIGAAIGDDVVASREIAKGSIAVINLHGVMSSTDDVCSYGVGYQVAQLRAAYGNPQVQAIILDVNSGGGEVTAMNMMMQAISERNKPIIGYGHFAASAAYGSIAATDEIIAAGDIASFGSIGAMMAIDMSYLEFYKRWVKFFYGDNAPRKNAWLRGAIEGDFTDIQKDVNLYTDKFHDTVKGLRALIGSENKIKETLSGEMFIAKEAKQRGLIDGVGNMNYAIKRARSWAQNFKK